MSNAATLALTLRSLSQKPLPAIAITHLRAQDASGSFAIQPGHADFVTVLVPSLLTWRDGAGLTRCAGVPGGVLHVTSGQHVAVLARHLYFGDTPDAVLLALQSGMAAARADEARLRTTLTQLEAEATAHLAHRLGDRPPMETGP